MKRTHAAKQINADISRLSEALRKRSQQRVLGYLKATRAPATAQAISEILGMPEPTVRLVLFDLLSAKSIALMDQPADGPATFRPYEIGRCEWCGMVSHYLIAGECPDHRAPTR